MKTKRFRKGMPAVFHSAPDFVLSGSPFSISAAYRAFGETAPEKLCFKEVGGKEYYLYPVDRYERKGTAYVIYRADIPASALIGDLLAYRIFEAPFVQTQ